MRHGDFPKRSRGRGTHLFRTLSACRFLELLTLEYPQLDEAVGVLVFKNIQTMTESACKAPPAYGPQMT